MSKPLVLLIGDLPPLVVDQISARFETLSYDSTKSAKSELGEKAEEIRGLAGVKAKVDGAFLDTFPNLKIIANYGVGYDSIDAAAARDRGVMVTNTPDVLNHDVADAAIGLLLMTIRRLSESERYLREGKWHGDQFPLARTTLRGRKVGIIGMGRIGEEIAKRLLPFGVELAYHARRQRDHLPYEYFGDLLAMATASDTLITIVPGGPETRHLINGPILDALGPDGILVNIARGSVVDEPALIDALQRGVILGAGLDVFEDEPNVPEALMPLENVVLLPHVGSSTVPTRNAMSQLVVDNIISWFDDRRAITPVAETVRIPDEA